jgi:hypothetical protein
MAFPVICPSTRWSTSRNNLSHFCRCIHASYTIKSAQVKPKSECYPRSSAQGARGLCWFEVRGSMLPKTGCAASLRRALTATLPKTAHAAARFVCTGIAPAPLRYPHGRSIQ